MRSLRGQTGDRANTYQIERTLTLSWRTIAPPCLRPGEDGYTAATAIWAKPVSPLPRAVVHCATTDDAQLAIRAARDCGLPLSVRGGGTTAPVLRCAPASSSISAA